jgi:FtsZ-binding cell division protein ZapB
MRRTLAAAVSVVAIATSVSMVRAQELAETTVITADNTRVHLYQQLPGPQAMLVQPKLGLNATLHEIDSKLNSALETHALTAVEVNEFKRRSSEVSAQLESARKDNSLARGEGQKIAGALFTLTEDINRRLSPAVADASNYSCPGGTCTAASPEGLDIQLKQLRRRLQDEVADGSLTPAQARWVQQEAARLARLGRDSGNPEGYQLANRSLRKLAARVERDGTQGRVAVRPASTSYLALPRAF